MTQNISTMRRKEKDERKENITYKSHYILHISHIVSSIICCLYVYINYFIFIIYYRHNNWFVGL